jgi:hydroxysqualene dehydroxylase
MPRTVPIISGGLAGFSAAVDLAARGVAIVMHEACKGPASDEVKRPLLAALNAEPSEATSNLVRAVAGETVGHQMRPTGAAALCNRPSAAFVEPAMAYLKKNGGMLHFSHQLRQCVTADDMVAGLDFGNGMGPVGPQDAVLPAVQLHTARSIIPKLQAPDEFRAIVNAHFFNQPPPVLEPMLGILNLTAEWIFSFRDLISATINGADRFMKYTKDELARLIWWDVRHVADVPAELSPWPVVGERRATFAATPSQNAKRPGVRTARRNLALAGDWSDTGLPATIKSAVRSGTRAAALLMQS